MQIRRWLEQDAVQGRGMHRVHYVYIVQCADGSLYTGWTTDVAARVRQHNQGKGAKYTRTRRPVRLCHVEEFLDKGDALRREYQIKRLARDKKLALLQDGHHFNH